MKREQLLQLVPAVYRDADPATSATLTAWLTVAFDQYLGVRAAVGSTYDGWFIDTCADWQVPYIADLVAAGTVSEPSRSRSLVANTIRWRRAKGTVGSLGGAVADVTGRAAVCRDGLSRMAFSQAVAAPAAGFGGTIDISDLEGCARLGTAFDSAARTVSVRSTDPIGPRTETVVVWNLVTAAVRGVAAGTIAGGYTFDPTGLDIPLFVPPRAGPPTIDTAPSPLSPRLLALEIAARLAGRAPETAFFGASAVFRLFAIDATTGALTEVTPTTMGIADLENPQAPIPDAANAVADPIAWVDVRRGRFTLADSALSCHATALTDLVGAWPQAHRLPEWASTVTTCTGGRTNLADLLTAWAASESDDPIAIVVEDSLSYTVGSAGSALAVDLRGRRLCVAAQYYTRPALLGSLTVTDSIGGGRLVLTGLLVRGALTCSGQMNLVLEGSTLIPGSVPAIPPATASVSLNAVGTTGSIRLESSIVGSISLGSADCLITIVDAIVDGLGSEAISGPDGTGPSLVAEGATFLGAVRCDQVDAADSIFGDVLVVARTTTGAIRTSWVPTGSVPPRTWDCEPKLGTTSPVRFGSVRFGDAEYARAVQPSVLATAGGGRSIGAFRRGSVNPADVANVVAAYARGGFAVGVKVTP